MPKCEKQFTPFTPVHNEGLQTQWLYGFERYLLPVHNEISLRAEKHACKPLIHRSFQFTPFTPLRGSVNCEHPHRWSTPYLVGVAQAREEIALCEFTVIGYGSKTQPFKFTILATFYCTSLVRKRGRLSVG